MTKWTRAVTVVAAAVCVACGLFWCYAICTARAPRIRPSAVESTLPVQSVTNSSTVRMQQALVMEIDSWNRDVVPADRGSLAGWEVSTNKYAQLEVRDWISFAGAILVRLSDSQWQLLTNSVDGRMKVQTNVLNIFYEER